MTTDEKKRHLIEHRLKQTKETLEDANFLFENNRSLRGVINRVYYALFYAVLALLVLEPFESSKHSGVIGYFNRRFIKDGVFSPEMGRYLNIAFEARQESDYKEFVELTKENVKELLIHAETFVNEVKKYLSVNL